MIPVTLALYIAALRWMRKSIGDYEEADKLRILLNDYGWNVTDQTDSFVLRTNF